MKIFCQQSCISFEGNNIQIFADISPMTIQRCRALKSLLMILWQKKIKHWWAFPFALKFEDERVLLALKFIMQDPTMDMSNLQEGSSKHPNPTSPISPTWKSHKNRRTKDFLPTWQLIRCSYFIFTTQDSALLGDFTLDSLSESGDPPDTLKNYPIHFLPQVWLCSPILIFYFIFFYYFLRPSLAWTVVQKKLRLTSDLLEKHHTKTLTGPRLVSH